MAMYIPLFSNRSLVSPDTACALTTEPAPHYAGCIATVFHFDSLLRYILSSQPLVSTDVFLFEPAPDGGGAARYIAHYESPPASNAPRLSPSEAEALRPGDLRGDIVTAFTAAFDVRIADYPLRVVVRAREGSLLRSAAAPWYAAPRTAPRQPPSAKFSRFVRARVRAHTPTHSPNARTPNIPSHPPSRHSLQSPPRRLSQGAIAGISAAVAVVCLALCAAAFIARSRLSTAYSQVRRGTPSMGCCREGRGRPVRY
jgi:hypothetical protein